jgi:oxygen-independent coproporphyrinogen-3 oxidase
MAFEGREGVKMLVRSSDAGAAVAAPASRPLQLWQATLDRLARQPATALAAGITLPFCATHCLCCDRDVRCAAAGQEVDAYLHDLLVEVALLRTSLGPRHAATRLHLAGGSLTELSEVQLLRLFDGLRLHGHVDAGASVSAHVDPRRFSPGLLRLLRGQGVTRLVLGVLDFDPQVQLAIGRHQPPDLVADACAQAREAGIEGVQFDLMTGLPRQTTDSWARTLAQVLALAPAQVRLREYRHRPRQAPVQAMFEAAALPDRGQCRQLALQARRQLQAAGYRPCGADLLLRPDQGTDDEAVARMPWLGCGTGAVSRIEGRVFFNAAHRPAWQALVQAGQLPVVQTRRQVWVHPGESPRRSRSGEHAHTVRVAPPSGASGLSQGSAP